MIEVVLRVAGNHGDKKLWDRLYGEARKAKDRQERARVLSAMAAFTDPEIVKANQAIALGDEFDLRDSFELMATGLTTRRGAYHPSPSRVVRQLAWTFVKLNWDAIVAKMPRIYAAYLTITPLALCSDEAKADMEAFFKERAAKLDGGPRVFAQMLEQMALCVENKKAKTPGVVAFLKKQ